MCIHGCYAWHGHPGSHSDWKALSADHLKCPVCTAERFNVVCGRLQPKRIYYMFSPKEQVKSLFRSRDFNDLLFQRQDLSMLAYRQSPDFMRLNAGDPTNQRWPAGFLDGPNTILVSVCSDGNHAHGNATQGHTGECPLWSFASLFLGIRNTCLYFQASACAASTCQGHTPPRRNL